jgi:hypothetical protein
VTLMLHSTFVGDDDDQVRETVREPMIDYRRALDPDRAGRLVVPGVQGVPRPGQTSARCLLRKVLRQERSLPS